MQRDGGDYLDGSRVNFSRSRDHRPPRVGVWFGPVETSGSPLLLLLFTDTAAGSPGRLGR